MSEREPITEPVPSRDGAWTWHQDPRMLYYDGIIYISAVDSEGSTWIAAYDPETDEMDYTMLSYRINYDDHIAPTIRVRNEDERIHVTYARDESRVWYRISQNPLDISSFQSEQTIEYPNHGNVSYPNIAQFESEGNRMYMWTRGSGPVNFDQFYRVSEDGGETWDAPVHFTEFGDNRGYLKHLPDYPRLWITIHVSNNEDTGGNDFFTVMYYEGGDIYAYDDTHIAEMGADSPDLPITRDDLEPFAIQFGEGNNTQQLRVWDLVLADETIPRVLTAKTHDRSQHEYYHHRWNPSNSEWETAPITLDAGGGIGRDYYSGGLTFDHSEPNVVYTSERRETIADIFRYETSDAGQTWTDEQITDNQGEDEHDRRPAPVHNCPPDVGPSVVWQHGRYDEFTDYDTVLTSEVDRTYIPEPDPMLQFGLHTSRRVKLPDGTRGRIKYNGQQ